MLSPGYVLVVNRVNQMVAETFKIKEELLFTKRRTKRIVDAKFVAWWVLNNRFDRSLVRIGKTYGKHHTTILNALQRIKHHDNERILEIAKKIEKTLTETYEKERIQMHRLQPVHSTSPEIQS